MISHMKGLYPLAIVALLVFGVMGLMSVPSSAQAPSGPTPTVATITVVGQGMVKAQPDIADVTVGVEETGPTAKDASDKARTSMNQVLQALKQQGIADKDIRTSAYNIWAEQPPRPQGSASPSQEKPIYHVSNQVSITIHELDKTGAILDAAVAAGANNIYGVSFDLADPSTFQSQARQKAVEDAHTKAAELAKAAGVDLGNVMSISEETAGGPPTPSFRVAAMAAPNAPSPISPGEIQLSTQVQIVYAIK